MSSGPSRLAAVARRVAARLVPAGRRDWVEAVWAEAPEVSPGWRRLAWHAGGVWLVARVTLRRRWAGSATLLAVAASAIAWGAWRSSSTGFAASVYRVDVITVVALLVALPLLARWLFGPALETRTAMFLRVGTYAAILILVPAKYVEQQVRDVRPRGGVDLRLYRLITRPGFATNWSLEIFVLVIVALYAVGILWVTSRRSRVAPATLAIGTGMGVALGLVLYMVSPLGISGDATNPWLPGADVDPLVMIAWLLVLFGPLAAAIIAVRRLTASSSAPPSGGAKVRQVLAAGLLSNLVGALVYATAATGTTAAMIRSTWVRHWLYHGGRQLYGVGRLRLIIHGDPGALAYSHQLTAVIDAGSALVCICIPFTVVAVIVTSVVAQGVWADTPRERDDPRRGGGGPEDPEPPWCPPDGDHPADLADDALTSAVGLLQQSPVAIAR